MTHTSPPSEPLAVTLLGAARAVALVTAGTALPQALRQVFADRPSSPAPMPASTRGATQDIAYRTMRQMGLAQGLLALLADKPVVIPVLQALLMSALTLLAMDAADDDAYDGFTVVNQAVDAAGRDPQMAHARGMVNAVLRRFLRERAPLLAQARKTPVGRWNYPVWWIDRVQAAYPDRWQAVLEAGNRPPPLTLRVNARKIAIEDYLAQLRQAGLPARRIGPFAIRLDKPVPVTQIPGFAEGLASVQDAAAQLAAPLLDVGPGMRVLDACAAPGGKTGHLLESTGGAIELVALDHDRLRIARVADNLERLQLQATLTTGDARSGDWWDGRRFDRILADVPCTASGIVRRHPDIRWLRRKTDTAQLATLSAAILDNLWQMLKPDGKLLLVTCSIWPQESEQQAAAFAARHAVAGRDADGVATHAVRLPAPGQLLPGTGAASAAVREQQQEPEQEQNREQDRDGLFFALFQKTATGIQC